MTKGKIFGVYIRVSTERQSLEGDSMEMQENLAKDIVKKEGGVLYKIYYEPAVSASKTKLSDRVQLMECLNDIKSGVINHLIVYRRDRLARKTEDSLAIRSILEKSGCDITFSARGEQQMDLDDVYSKLTENIRASLDEIESAQTSARVSDTMIDKAKRGEFSGGNVTYGYRNEDGFLKPIESEIEVIKEVVSLYLQGHGIHSICRWLNGMKAKNLGIRKTLPVKLKQHKRSSDKWTIETIKAILFNLTYSGYMEYKSVKNKEMETIIVKSDYIEPIRSEETQRAINRLRDKKLKERHPPRRYNTPFLLTGVLRCSNCGGDYISNTSQRKEGSRYSYYVCRNRNLAHAGKCNSRSYKKETLESFVLMESKRYVNEFVNSDVYEIVKKDLLKKEGESFKQLEELRKTIAGVEKDFQAIRRLLLDLDTESDMYELLRDTYQEDQKETLIKLSDLKKTEKNLREKLETQEEDAVDIDTIIKIARDFNNGIDSAPVNIQKQLIEELFSSIEIDANGDITMVMAVDVIDKGSSPIVDFISLGGVGDTTTLKGITINLQENSTTSNIIHEMESVLNTVSETILPYLLSHDPSLSSPKNFAMKTGVSVNSLSGYRRRVHTPTYKTVQKMLSGAGSSFKEYVKHLRKSGMYHSESFIQIALDEYQFIKESVSEHEEKIAIQ